MRRHPQVLMTAVLAVLAPAFVPAAEPLAVKTGLWETTTVTTTTGMQMPQIPPEALAQMPPAQRAQMEAAMKQLGANGPSTRTDRNCVTAEDLKDGIFKALRDNDDRSCKYNVVKATATHQELEMTCGGQMAANGRMKVDVVDSGSVRGEMDMKSPQVTMNMKFNSRWLGANCPADVKKQ